MIERIKIAEATESPWDPNLRLAEIFKKKKPGLRIQKEPILDEEPVVEGGIALTVDLSQRHNVEDWHAVATTKDFLMLRHATNGNVEFFEQSEISSEELVIINDEKGFLRFYNFVRALAYDRAIEQNMLWERYDQVKELKLKARGAWVPTLSGVKKTFASYYVNSILGRVYNLVTTGEERPSLWDRCLDIVY